MYPEKPTILYVDDEEINLFIFERSFEKKFKVVTAHSAKDALNILGGNETVIDILISDMRMPVMNGIELINKAKEHHPKIMYYILTGFEFNSDIEEACESNLIKKFFKKPINVQEIETSIFGELPH
jgi:response regulator RpfG family c-di-GMP phosphodiesterase